MTMSKAELIEKLTSDEDNKRLETDPRWKLRTKVVCWRFVAFSHFMEDVHEQLAILSKSFQSNSLIVYDISRNVNKTLKALQKLGEKVGTREVVFWSEVKKDEEADVLRTCQLSDGSSGRVALKEDRKQTLAALNDHLIERFTKVLDDPVLLALTAFDHTKWPRSENLLDGLYDDSIEKLYNAYQRFYEPTETLEDVLEEWNEMIKEINKSDGLMLSKHHDMWPRMLVHSHNEYPLALRLVAISMLIPADTSECERIFSLMNDIKTVERSNMMTRNLKNLMIWHRLARKLEEDGSLSKKHLSFYDVPVMPIVKEFRDMAGVRSRKAHRAWKLPNYDYQKGLTKEAKESMEMAKDSTPRRNLGGKASGGQHGSAEKHGSAERSREEQQTQINDGEQPEVDNRQAGGHFARWGEAGSSDLGEHAGQHLPRRFVAAGS